MFNLLVPLVSEYREILVKKGISQEEIEKKILTTIQESSDEAMQDMFMTFEDPDITSFEDCIKNKDVAGMEKIFKKYNLNQSAIESKVCESFKKKMEM